MHALLHSMPPALQQATTNPCLCRSLLDTYWQVWVSFLWSHCSFLLGPGAHKVLFVPTKSLVNQLYCILFPDSSDGKESVYNARDLGSTPGSGRSLETGIAAHSSILAWRIPWTEQPGRLLPWGGKELDTTELLIQPPTLFSY